jgi:hypothetical protein
VTGKTSSADMVSEAYRLLKRDAYFDKTDLFLRANIAAYEASGSFGTRQDDLAAVVDELRRNITTTRGLPSIKKWLEQIDFRLLPKSVKLPDIDQSPARTDGSPRFLSNVRESKKYIIKEGCVQYFIHAPIELYILSTIWCMTVGPELDQVLDNGCFGNRLELDSGEDKKNTARLFKFFHFQYTKWRNTAIERAEDLLEHGSSAVIVSLDIKQFYYHLSIDWDLVPVPRKPGLINLAKNLNSILADIHSAYRTATKDLISLTHGFDDSSPEGTPVGLPSSRVLSNWMLREFDSAVRVEMQPAYYGRYVDDMLIVVQAPADSVANSGATAILGHFLVNRGLLRPMDNGSSYHLRDSPDLVIQTEKIVIQHFDKNHSRAGLREFIREIQREASDFRFLPADDRGRELDACAYDIIYEGSINKLQSVIGVAENGTELSKFLARRIVEHRLTTEALQKDVAEQIDRFSRGKNLLDFCTTWERFLTLLIIKNQQGKAAGLLRRCLEAIDALHPDGTTGEKWSDRIKSDLKTYLELALAMPLALLSNEPESSLRSKQLNEMANSRFRGVQKHADNFRISNLLRHQWVAWPLLNYTNYRGSLVSFNPAALIAMKNWDTENARTWTPRHIHLDEEELFELLRSIILSQSSGKPFIIPGLPEPIEKRPTSIPESIPNAEDVGSSSIRIRNCHVSGDSVDKLVIGIANMNVNERDISASYEPLRSPNTSWERQVQLFRLLNLAEKEDCDMLVLPEVSVPYSWLPFMVAHARHTQMALIFGMEHWVVGNTAYNLLVSVLPYKEGDRYRACRVFYRPKNHYSPAELHELSRLDLTVPSANHAYDLYNWRGSRFTVFNCFELTDIHHRGAFRGKIDFLIGAEWNRDTKYFSNIVESTVRDLHCYMVQVNTSQFGDSRITAPKKSAEMNATRVSGGLNTTLLKAEIDIRDLNDFRSKRSSPTDSRYKPAPAGFEHENIRASARQTNDGNAADD